MRVISYFGLPSSETFIAHLAEIRAAGFDTVLLCVPWLYATDSDHLSTVRNMIAVTRHAGLAVWADPWGLSGMDGEADPDPYGDPDRAVSEWLDTIGNAPPESRPDAVFLDNPHALDPPHQADTHLIASWGARAKGYGMGCQVCLSADRHRNDRAKFERVARLDVVDGVWVDVNAPGRPDGFDFEGWVGNWADGMAGIAHATGKPVGAFVPGYGIPVGQEDLPVRAIQVAIARGVEHVGLWWIGWSGPQPTPGGPVYRREVWDGFGE